jgi:hypothetical protein
MAQPANSDERKGKKRIQTSPTDCVGMQRNREKCPTTIHKEFKISTKDMPGHEDLSDSAKQQLMKKLQ